MPGLYCSAHITPWLGRTSFLVHLQSLLLGSDNILLRRAGWAAAAETAPHHTFPGPALTPALWACAARSYKQCTRISALQGLLLLCSLFTLAWAPQRPLCRKWYKSNRVINTNWCSTCSSSSHSWGTKPNRHFQIALTRNTWQLNSETGSQPGALSAMSSLLGPCIRPRQLQCQEKKGPEGRAEQISSVSTAVPAG